MGPGLILPIIFMAQFIPPPAPSVLDAFNQFRANPSSYVTILEERRKYFVGNLLKIPGEPDLLTSEGVAALDEAVEQIRSMRVALSPVVLSDGLCHAAADHVVDTGGIGITSHTGTDGSSFTKRIARYGTTSGAVSEVIDYGARDAAEVILDLLVDDGVANRGHRKSVLDPRWHYVGIACGPHSVLRTMCVIDFAAGYQNGKQAPQKATRTARK